MPGFAALMRRTASAAATTPCGEVKYPVSTASRNGQQPSASSADSMSVSSAAGMSRFTRRPRPGRLDSRTVGSAHTSWPRYCSAGTVAARPTAPRTTCDEIASTLPMASSNHIALAQRPALGDAAVAQARQIDGLEGTVHDQLRDCPSSRRALLRAMPGESIGEVEIAQPRVWADDGVLVESVVVVVAGPRVH